MFKNSILLRTKEFCFYCYSNQKGTVKRHKEVMHSIKEGVTYPCNQCHYNALQKSDLKVHTETVHGGVYSCDQCNFTSTMKNILQRHELKAHVETIRTGAYNCEGCGFSTKVKSAFQSHMIKQHPVRRDNTTNVALKEESSLLPTWSIMGQTVEHFNIALHQ